MTSTALALATAGGAVLVDGDPAGGDVVFRCESNLGALAENPGLVSLAAAARNSSDAGVLGAHCQETKGGLPVVVGVTNASQGQNLLPMWPAIIEAVRASGSSAIFDLGRLNRGTATIAAEMDAVVWLTTASSEGAHHLRESISDLQGGINTAARRAVPLIPAVVSTNPGGDAAALDGFLAHSGLPVRPAIGIAFDPSTLSRIQLGGKTKARSGLLRSAAEIIQAVNGQTRQEVVA